MEHWLTNLAAVALPLAAASHSYFGDMGFRNTTHREAAFNACGVGALVALFVIAFITLSGGVRL